MVLCIEPDIYWVSKCQTDNRAGDIYLRPNHLYTAPHSDIHLRLNIVTGLRRQNTAVVCKRLRSDTVNQ